MERMKVEIEKSEYDRLKSREEKYLAYMDMLSYRGEDKTYVDALCGKVAELEEENNALRENVNHRAGRCADLSEENDKLKIHIEAKDKAYMDLLADYNYLKARIKKTERAFLKYEEKQEKLLGDLDMVVMNR